MGAGDVWVLHCVLCMLESFHLKTVLEEIWGNHQTHPETMNVCTKCNGNPSDNCPPWSRAARMNKHSLKNPTRVSSNVPPQAIKAPKSPEIWLRTWLQCPPVTAVAFPKWFWCILKLQSPKMHLYFQTELPAEVFKNTRPPFHSFDVPDSLLRQLAFCSLSGDKTFATSSTLTQTIRRSSYGSFVTHLNCCHSPAAPCTAEGPIERQQLTLHNSTTHWSP